MSTMDMDSLRDVLDARDLVGWASSFVSLGLYLAVVWLSVPASQVTWHWFGVGAVVSTSPFGAWFIQSRRGARALDRADAHEGLLRPADASRIVNPFRGAVAVAAWLVPALCLLVLILPA
jgi:hypothetical protein